MLVATMCLQNSQRPRLQADPATPVLHEYTYESACADLLTEGPPSRVAHLQELRTTALWRRWR